MGVCPALRDVGPARRRLSGVDSHVRLAPAARRSGVEAAHQPIADGSGQPVDAPHLDAVVRSPERLGRQFGRYGISAGASIPITDEISAHIGPDLRGALLALVEARQALAQWDEAMQCLERLRRAEPEDVLVTLSLVELLSARATNDQPALRRILRLTQGVENETELHAGLMLYRGRALRGLGLLEAARDCLSAGLRRRKSRPDALLCALRYERALVYEGLGQRAGARAKFGRLYAEDADYEDVAERLGFQRWPATIRVAVTAPPATPVRFPAQ